MIKPPVKEILIADEDTVLQEFYTCVLTDLGYETSCVADGSDAIRLLQEAPGRYSLVVLGLNLPGRADWNLIDFIRNTPGFAKIPIIAIPGFSVDNEALKRLNKACDSVIAKGTFEINRLCKTIRRALDDESAGCHMQKKDVEPVNNFAFRGKQLYGNE